MISSSRFVLKYYYKSYRKCQMQMKNHKTKKKSIENRLHNEYQWKKKLKASYYSHLPCILPRLALKCHSSNQYLMHFGGLWLQWPLLDMVTWGTGTGTILFCFVLLQQFCVFSAIRNEQNQSPNKQFDFRDLFCIAFRDQIEWYLFIVEQHTTRKRLMLNLFALTRE